MKRFSLYGTTMILTILLTVGWVGGITSVQAASFQVPEVTSISTNPSGSPLAGKQVTIQCTWTGMGKKTLSKDQEKYLGLQSWLLPGEIQIDGKKIKTFNVAGTNQGAMISEKASWTPGTAGMHTLTCIIDPDGNIHASSKNKSVQVVTKVARPLRRLPHVVNQRGITQPQSKPAPGLPKPGAQGGAGSRLKLPSSRGGISISPTLNPQPEVPSARGHSAISPALNPQPEVPSARGHSVISPALNPQPEVPSAKAPSLVSPAPSPRQGTASPKEGGSVPVPIPSPVLQ